MRASGRRAPTSRRRPKKTQRLRKHPMLPRGVRVFMNIPYIRVYEQLELAEWLVLKVHGLEPVILREFGPRHDRIAHLLDIIRACDYGLSDFSMSRGNIQIEHGLLLAELQNSRRADCLRAVPIIDNAARIPTELSDLQGFDFIVHGWDPGVLIVGLTQWIRSNVREAKAIRSMDRLLDYFETMAIKYRSRYGRISTFYETYGATLREQYLRFEETEHEPELKVLTRARAGEGEWRGHA